MISKTFLRVPNLATAKPNNALAYNNAVPIQCSGGKINRAYKKLLHNYFGLLHF